MLHAQPQITCAALAFTMTDKSRSELERRLRRCKDRRSVLPLHCTTERPSFCVRVCGTVALCTCLCLRLAFDHQWVIRANCNVDEPWNKDANDMANACMKQFRSFIQGTAKPDYENGIVISTRASLTMRRCAFPHASSVQSKPQWHVR